MLLNGLIVRLRLECGFSKILDYHGGEEEDGPAYTPHVPRVLVFLFLVLKQDFAGTLTIVRKISNASQRLIS